MMSPNWMSTGVVQAMRAEQDFATPRSFSHGPGRQIRRAHRMNFGADDYLTKPIIREDLLAGAIAAARADSVAQKIQAAVGPARFNPDLVGRAVAHQTGITFARSRVRLWVARVKQW